MSPGWRRQAFLLTLLTLPSGAAGNEIGQLAAIATLRTALNYFLERELEAAPVREPGAARGADEAAEPG